MIKSLFLKIFLWFWLAMAAISFVLIVMLNSESVSPSQRALIDSALTEYGRRAVLEYELEGPSALGAYLDRTRHRTRLRVYLFAAGGGDLTGRLSRGDTLSPEISRLVQQAFTYDVPVVEGAGWAIVGVRPIHSLSGRSYVFAGVMPRGVLTAMHVPARLRALRFVAVFLTGCLVCYALAYYLTAPILKVRLATRDLASGNLGVRVSKSIGPRRDELADLGRDFDVMAERMESMVTSERRLLSDMSHELRSPLARLNVALSIARRHASPESVPSLDRIERETERMNELIGQMLALTRYESGETQAGTEMVNVTEVVEQVAADANYEAQSENRRVQVLAQKNCIVRGSQELLRRAVENVVRNALHWTAEQTAVEVRVECNPSPTEPSTVRIVVRDHGPGVPAEALSDLFKPFYRVEDARDRGSGGTGLGLAITERAIRSHGGTATARNAEGGGLQIEISVPASKLD